MTNRDISRQRKATLAAVCAVVLWYFTGVTFLVGTHSIGPMPFLSIVCCLGALSGAIAHYFSNGSLKGLLRRSPANFAVDTLMTGYILLFTIGVNLANTADMGQIVLTNYLWPVWIVALGPLFGKTKLTVTAAAGALLGFTAVAIARGATGLLRPASSYLPHLLVLLGSFAWAIYSVLLGRAGGPKNDENGVPFQFAVCAILAAVIGLVSGDWHGVARIGWTQALCIVFCGVGPMGFAYYLWEYSVKNGDPSKAAILAYTTPIGGALVVGLIFRESLSAALLPSAGLLVFAAFLTNRGAAVEVGSSEGSARSEQPVGHEEVVRRTGKQLCV